MKHYLTLLLTISILSTTSYGFAQTSIAPAKGYDHDIGNMVAMLEDLKGRIVMSTQELNLEQTDFLLDEKANRIGAMIMHLAATEAYYQVSTFENRVFNEEEKEKWMTALTLGEDAQTEFVGKPINFYLDTWADVRANTLEQLKTKNDKWFAKKIKNSPTNNHWAWFHVMEHQANHMGQINMLRSRLPE